MENKQYIIQYDDDVSYVIQYDDDVLYVIQYDDDDDDVLLIFHLLTNYINNLTEINNSFLIHCNSFINQLISFQNLSYDIFFKKISCGIIIFFFLIWNHHCGMYICINI